MHRWIPAGLAGRALPFLLIVMTTAAGCGTARAPHEGVDWNRYYSTAQTYEIMETYARRYPGLTRIFSIGRSWNGQDLLVIEVTNKRTAAASEKPALYVDGNIHAGELTGSAVTLYLMSRLLDLYGADPDITRLVDTRTFYLRPKFNPDGADLALLRDISLRSTPHPWDEDGDGQEDEDPEEDLNRDGFITDMRIPDDSGPFWVSDEDPRLMVRRRAGDAGPFYRVVGEGTDQDGDGRLNEDGIGGLDMNRNFPRNWELPFIQPGAGPYPLSEPETRATVEFIIAHPNITGIVHNHTSGGFVYRLPSASDPTRFPAEDLALIEILGAEYTRTTGRPVEPSSTDPVNHRYGTLISWAYWDRGVIGWVPEYWPGLRADADGDGRTSEIERLRFVDDELGGRYFVPWKYFEHPDLGWVEIGGWRSRFISQNPPPELLEEECALQIPWLLYLAEQAPLLTALPVRIEDSGDGRYEVFLGVTNEGYLPTNLTLRGMEAEVIPPVTARIELQEGELAGGDRRQRLGHIEGGYAVPYLGTVPTGVARWVVRAGSSGARFRIVVESHKGGTLRLGPFTAGR